MKREATAIVLLLAAAVIPNATAGKAPQTAPSASSIAQYVEQAPTAAGSVPLGRGSGTVAQLTPAARKALSQSGGGDASTLQKIAVDPQYGAPAQSGASNQTQLRRPSAKKPATHAGVPRTTGKQATSKARTTPGPSTPSTSAVGPAPPSGTPNALSAAGSTVGVGNLWVLAIVLGAIAAAGLLLARRQRSH